MIVTFTVPFLTVGRGDNDPLLVRPILATYRYLYMLYVYVYVYVYYMIVTVIGPFFDYLCLLLVRFSIPAEQGGGTGVSLL